MQGSSFSMIIVLLLAIFSSYVFFRINFGSSKYARPMSGSLLLVLSGLSALGALYLSFTTDNVNVYNNTLPDLSTTIANVSDDLKNISSEISRIQYELEQRIQFVEGLNEEAKDAEAMIALSEDQIAAIRSAINKTLNKNDVANFWTSFGMNFLFMILGIIVGNIAQNFLEKQKRKMKVPELEKNMDIKY